MPRGGPKASCLDRALYTDRAARLGGEWFGDHRRFAHLALDEVADVPDPRILELGAGRGRLSARLLEAHPTAHATVTDSDADAVASIQLGELGDHPRATVRTMDATAIDAPDGAFDLAIFVLSLHQLPPDQASRVLSEGARAADKILVVDPPRPPAPLHLLQLATMLPFVAFLPCVHAGVIGSLRSYSPSALRALANHAGVDVELRGGVLSPQVAVVRPRGARQSTGPDLRRSQVQAD